MLNRSIKLNMLKIKNKQHIHISVEDANCGFERFVEAWHNSEAGEIEQAEMHLGFGDFAMLASLLTAERLRLMKTLRQHGPLRVSELSKQMERDYNNVHEDAGVLEEVNLIHRTEEGLLVVPWDVIDAHVRSKA